MRGLMAEGRLATGGVLVGWTLLGIGDSAAEGQFSHFSLACVLAGLGVVVVVVASGARLAIPDGWLLAIPVAGCLVAVIHHPASRYIAMSSAGLHATQALVIAASGIALLSLWARRAWRLAAFLAIAGLVTAAALTTVGLDSHPGIDVWVLLQQSSDGLRHGADMYRQHWIGSNGLQAVYPYLPGTTVLLAPFRWLFGDVRYGLIAASVLAAWLVRRTAPDAPAALPALILIAPHWVFLIDQSWSEPLLIAALAGAILALRSERPWLAVIALAVALACKQHIVVLLPLFAIWPSFGLRRAIAAGALAVLAILPWIIAGPRDIWHDAVHANLALGVQTRALNLPSLFARHGVTFGFWFLIVMIAAAYALVIFRLPRTPSGLALGAALVMWTLDVSNKQTYFNHYTLPLALLVIAVAAAERPGAASRVRPGRATDAADLRR
jgi:hypothetical protein